jgi:hypothetical protein
LILVSHVEEYIESDLFIITPHHEKKKGRTKRRKKEGEG